MESIEEQGKVFGGLTVRGIMDHRLRLLSPCHTVAVCSIECLLVRWCA